ncbi:alpha/beta hydrolase fold domain-containing protein [Actinomadura luteofluorescens]|uniref:alpha/beta hydrolase fold domain-containing protein n=1 Tax=Actinomadura luteofluorescens TaxID=46163 RepID=UPI00364429BD
MLGGVDNVDAFCRDLAAEAECVVLNVGYRLAPEHPFPAAVDDAWAVVSSVAREPGRYGVRRGPWRSPATAPAGTSPRSPHCWPGTPGSPWPTSSSSTR